MLMVAVSNRDDAETLDIASSGEPSTLAISSARSATTLELAMVWYCLAFEIARLSAESASPRLSFTPVETTTLTSEV